MPPTSPNDRTSAALPDPAQQQCVTPPSVRRREVRLARCAMIQRGQREGGSGEQAREEVERANYTPDEVVQRRRERVARTREAERAGRTYDGPQASDAGILRSDGTIDWQALDRALQPSAAEGTVLSVDTLPRIPPSPLHFPSIEPTLQAPSLPALRSPITVSPALSSNALPLLLGSIYLVARALGIGERSTRRTERDSGADRKVTVLEGDRRPSMD